MPMGPGTTINELSGAGVKKKRAAMYYIPSNIGFGEMTGAAEDVAKWRVLC